MPELKWIGKEQVINHHLDVPFRLLNHEYNFTTDTTTGNATESTGNAIIKGDNLEALKSLLPQYEGRINCIYIDPPYNTGNEGWVYNDNVNDPKIKKWLAQVVGKEGEDLSRHDKWLCMMYPRLQLLYKLLADDGAIFISIDDNEQANLKLVMDEIFGGGNFLGNVCWQKKQSPQNDAINFSDMHDFVVVYAKKKKTNRNDTIGFNRNLIPKTIEQKARYKNPDNDSRGVWASVDCTSNKTKYERPNLYYSIFNPVTEKEIFPSESTVWRYEASTFNNLLNEKKIYFGKDGNSFPRLKLFLTDVADGIVPSTWWTRDFAGDNQEGRRMLRSIFGNVNDDFSTPKPNSLIERIFQIATNNNSIILDSFAGSGTTAHAVLNLNKQDGGHRKFILVEMEDYAETITAERVKRVIKGYNNTEGTGGSFDYYTLGQPLFDEDGELNPEAPMEAIRQYIWYTETKTAAPIPQSYARNLTGYPQQGKGNDSAAFLGLHQQTAYYFNYNPGKATTLNLAWLKHLRSTAETHVVYADNCTLNKQQLQSRGIIFKKIPRDITKL